MGRLTAMGHGDEIMVHNDANVRFYKGSDSTSSGSLGRLVITDQYKEKYLIAYSLIRGKRYGEWSYIKLYPADHDYCVFSLFYWSTKALVLALK